MQEGGVTKVKAWPTFSKLKLDEMKNDAFKVWVIYTAVVYLAFINTVDCTLIVFQRVHGGAVVSTCSSQEEGSWFENLLLLIGSGRCLFQRTVFTGKV